MSHPHKTGLGPSGDDDIVESAISTIMVEYATIQVRKETKRLLEKARQPGETFDQVLRRKLDEAEAQATKAFFDEMYAALADRKNLKPLR